MLIRKRFWAGIEDGSITVAFRRWRRPTVKAGGTLQSPVGLLGIDTVEVIDEHTITPEDAECAGYGTLDELHRELSRRSDGVVHRIAFHRIGEDPRIALRNDPDLSAGDVAEITRRLARFDAAGSRGPWTAAVLALIAANPGRRAPDLADEMSQRTGVLWETQPFKTDVRKLKALGLTESLQIGYRISPRGEAYLDAVADSP